MSDLYRMKHLEMSNDIRRAKVVPGKYGPTTFLFLRPETAILDKYGYVHLMYIDQDEFQDNPANLILAPRNSTQAKIANFIGEWLLPFGVSHLIDEKLNAKQGEDFNIAKFVAGAVAANLLIKPILEIWQNENSAYYDIVTKELVYLDPIVIHKSFIQKI